MKRVMLLLSVIMLLTGCTLSRIDDKSIDGVVTTILSQKLKYTNAVGRGYKYYLPMGVSRQSVDDFNERLYSSGDTYYLFIDVVGYLNKTEVLYPSKENSYFYKDLDKNGYVVISEVDNKYFAKIYYNYSYVESYIEKGNLNSALINILSILKSVSFSDNILTLGKNSEIVGSYEEKFNIKTNDREEVNFLDYEKQYDKYEGPDIDITGDNQDKTTDLEDDIITKENANE